MKAVHHDESIKKQQSLLKSDFKAPENKADGMVEELE